MAPPKHSRSSSATEKAGNMGKSGAPECLIRVRCPAMRLWLVLSVFVSSAALGAPRQSVVLSGPAPLTKWLSKELSKRYKVQVTARPVAARPTARG